MSRGRQEQDKDGESSLSGLAQRIKPLAEDIVRIQKQAKALGIFVNDRELLECPDCDLVEDVASDGSLMTYPRKSDDVTDSGLRFEKMAGNKYRCAACGTVFKADLRQSILKNLPFSTSSLTPRNPNSPIFPLNLPGGRDRGRGDKPAP